MTPFKTPKQMMMEMAGLPHYSGGREVLGKYVSSGVKQLMDEAVKRFTRSAGRAPHPQEMAELEQHAQQFARPKYTPDTDPVTQARAAHALRVDPNINTEMAPIYARDPFLTQQAFGRGVKGTHFAPETLDINDQKVAQMVGEEVGGFRSAGAPKASLTPGAEWMVEKSEDVIARQLGGKGDIGGQLKQAFLEKTGRNPNEDEMNALIAAFNPARHNFTGQQIGDVLVQRPKSRVGMPEWRENARATGLPESYTEHRPLGYSQNLKDEMALASGQVPSAQPEFEREAAKIAKRRNRPAPEPKEVTYDENGVPHYHYAGGGVITPRDMQADLMVNNRYAGGRTVSPREFMDAQNVRQEGYIKDLQSSTDQREKEYAQRMQRQRQQQIDAQRAHDTALYNQEVQALEERQLKDSPTQGGLPFRPFGVDTGYTMPEFMSNALAASGKNYMGYARGVPQAFGMGDQKEIDAAAERDRPLMETGAGDFGSMVLDPINLIPFAANTYKGAAGLGALMGGAQPVTTQENPNVALGKLENAALLGSMNAGMLGAQRRIARSPTVMKATELVGKGYDYAKEKSANALEAMYNRIRNQ